MGVTNSQVVNEMLVASSRGLAAGREIDIPELVNLRLFKTLSLLLAKAAGVQIPNTLLLLGDPDTVREVWGRWTNPLILRVDFTKYPERKVLGGIAISCVDRLIELCGWLQGNGYVPLLHSYINLYNAGILISSDGNLCVEVLGPGFDASGLRLGTANPHEVFNIVGRHETTSAVIPHEKYLKERLGRLTNVARLKVYTDSVEGGGPLLANLEHLSVEHHIDWASSLVPDRYVPMPAELRRELRIAALRIQSDVVPSLPDSPALVASFSYIKGHGWLLWDVYGHWYVR